MCSFYGNYYTIMLKLGFREINGEGYDGMNFIREMDVVVIGGGVTGTAILRELSKYDLKCMLVEKEPDLALGTTKANSAIIHSGFDAPYGSKKALTNVRGNRLYHELQDQLGLDIKWLGSLVVAVDDEEMATLKDLLARGIKNGVKNLEILDREATLAKEPNLKKDIRGALWAPTAGVCWPFEVALSFARCAVQNGAEVLTNCIVEKILTEGGKVIGISTSLGNIKAKYVINAAGLYADTVARTAGDNTFTIHPRKGEYILFDKTASEVLVKGIVFPTPTKTSKGILICTTVHGNTFIGPNAQDQEDKDDRSTTSAGMNEIISSSQKLIDKLPLGKAITEFSGLRAVSDTGDFIIRESTVKGLIHAAGIQSPGLSAAPAIAEEVLELLKDVEPVLGLKRNFKAVLSKRKVFSELKKQEQAKLCSENELYARIICRCETVTEGEIVDAIHETCGARTLDGIKRRTRAGMGRCQGGFCGPKVTQILARELGIPITEVLKEGINSAMFYEKEPAGEDA
jgi:glycerol-3-phosphate dehydrogenase